MAVGSGRAAFFDVDGTLLRTTSIFRFLAHDLAQRGQPPHVYSSLRAELARCRAAGASRVETNRGFYRYFSGREVAQVLAEGERWFATEEDAFDLRVLDALHGHAAAGDLIVLLSGSFRACLTPIARRVGAHAILCTEPEIVDGHYTGWVETPMVGPNKAVALLAFADEHGLTPADCFAYGDDSSDIDMLEAVGHPVVVGTDDDLLHHAIQRGYRRIPSLLAPDLEMAE